MDLKFNKKFLVLSLFMISVLILSGCNNDVETEPTYHTLNVAIEGEGTITDENEDFKLETDDSESIELKEGDVIEFTASAVEGWVFSSWAGDIQEEKADEETVILEMNQDKSIEAEFERQEYPLKIDIEGEGEVQKEILAQASEEDYPYETELSLKAEPETGWEFQSWQGDINSEENPVEVKIEEEKEVTAVFEKKEYSLELNTEGEGQVDLNPEKEYYYHGEEITFSVSSKDNWGFSHWTGDISGEKDQIEVEVTDSLEITAVFLPTYNLSVNTEGNGSIEVDPDRENYLESTEVDLTADSDPGWEFQSWQGDIDSNETSINIDMNQDKEITAIFEREEYELNTLVEGEGDIGLNPDEDYYYYEDEVEINAVSEEGWEFNQWKEEEKVEHPYSTTTVLTMKGDSTITATFTRKDFDFEIDTHGEGEVEEEILVSTASSYPYETLVELTAVPEENWEFSHWDGDLDGKENPKEFEVTGETQGEAVFKELYTLNINVEEGGNVEKSPDKEKYLDGTEVQLSAQPDKGWSFVEWTGDKSSQEKEIEIEMNEDVEIKAKFQHFAGGSGTEDDPYLVETAEHLDHVRNYPEQNFKQIDDIDLSEYSDGAGWTPINEVEEDLWDEEGFRGTYNGNDYSISNLKIDREDDDYVGLFGYLNFRSIVKNLTLESFQITGQNYAGGLAGLFEDGEIKNITIRDNNDIEDNVIGTENVGGLVGKNSGEIKDIEISEDISVVGEEKIGGLAGKNEVEIKDCLIKANVRGYERDIGGIIGNNDGTVLNVEGAGNIEGEEYVGGLAGYSSGEIINSKNSGNINGERSIGGLVGWLLSDGLIENSESTGEVEGNSNLGGLVGETQGNIIDSHNESKVYGEARLGGISGRARTSSYIENSSSVGKVTGAGSSIGGFIGSNRGDVKNSSSKTNVEGEARVGGFIGSNSGDIKESFAEGDVEGEEDRIGGFVGSMSDGYIGRSYSENNVKGQDKVGGFVGKTTLSNEDIFEENYSSGEVEGNHHVGGFIGENDGFRTDIINCYTTVEVDGIENVGGFVGTNESGSIHKSYAAGSVDAVTNAGGFVGIDRHTIENSFYDKEVTGYDDIDTGYGPKSTEKMMQEETFLDHDVWDHEEWDFIYTWEIDEGETYPYFQWQEENIPQPPE